tara:strand:- start:791 stop:1474 length:684 start_codon:yes stop_codon:yes gene_type:complete
MKGHKIEVQKRELSNKKSFVKELRKQDNIPGIYYSHDSKESIPFTIDKKILHEALKADTQVYKITVGGKDRDVIIKSVQYHPVSDQMVHIDLYGVKMDQKVTVKVPITLTGQAEGIRSGGILNQTLTDLEVSCLPSNIPQNIEVDITDLDIGDSIRLEQVPVSEGVDLVGDLDLLIASIVLPAKVEEAESEVDELSEADEETINADDTEKTDSNESQEGNDTKESSD